MAVLFAVCEGTSAGEQVIGVAIALAIAVFWLGMTWLSVGFEMEPAERRLLAGLWVACAAVGSILIATLHGDIVGMLLGALLLGLAIGVGGVLYTKRASLMHGVGVAVTGSMIVPVAIVVVMILHVSVGGGCLGDELG